MYIKMNLPGKMGIRIIPSFYSMFLKKKNEVQVGPAIMLY